MGSISNAGGLQPQETQPIQPEETQPLQKQPQEMLPEETQPLQQQSSLLGSDDGGLKSAVSGIGDDPLSGGGKHHKGMEGMGGGMQDMRMGQGMQDMGGEKGKHHHEGNKGEGMGGGGMQGAVQDMEFS
jgi:hypothetical protein